MSSPQGFTVEIDEPEGDRVLIRVKGELDMAAAPDAHRGHRRRRRAAHASRLDLSGVTFLDSSAIGALVASGREVGEAGSRLEIGPRSDIVTRVLEITGLGETLRGLRRPARRRVSVTVATEPTLRLELSPDPRLLRVLRLVASGVASLGEFDLAAVEEVRVAVDELGATLISASTGGADRAHLRAGRRHPLRRGPHRPRHGAELEVDPLTDRILDVVATRHEWSSAGGVAHGRFEKSPSPAAVPS